MIIVIIIITPLIIIKKINIKMITTIITKF